MERTTTASVILAGLLLVACGDFENRQVLFDGDWEEEGDTYAISSPKPDADGDGDPDVTDCEPENPAVHHGANEVAYDGIDQDCDGTDLVDVDGDGYVAVEVGGDDCKDNVPTINPDAEEICNGTDDDCDNLIDDEDDHVGGQQFFYYDEDSDGYGGDSDYACELPSDSTQVGGDCNDDAPSFYPGAVEVCGVDQNCDGQIRSCDEVDNDGDGFSEEDGDCDDEDPDNKPTNEGQDCSSDQRW
ncbi:hypothetical protein CO172_00395 [Candidatus Uhrbacteria bacterium CG_4_9_14_3_um_filter_36_7]|uniref:Regulator of chromosome condensation n=1 Tax=Candidatus Uhrbacteria bacterium CG_4_9_14_3_um_filter_36_7 TaxID=1975033 RepID=A0A2M7XIA7_9BACT|nr:MAG: hypothetical protein CO172_00395 [Candidatus Uhrbacteria bacterium CG_4_9_14_3_um_filter_36_7]